MTSAVSRWRPADEPAQLAAVRCARGGLPGAGAGGPQAARWPRIGTPASTELLSLALLFALSAPWRGSVQVDGDAIDAVVSDLDSGLFMGR